MLYATTLLERRGSRFCTEVQELVVLCSEDSSTDARFTDAILLQALHNVRRLVYQDNVTQGDQFEAAPLAWLGRLPNLQEMVLCNYYSDIEELSRGFSSLRKLTLTTKLGHNSICRALPSGIQELCCANFQQFSSYRSAPVLALETLSGTPEGSLCRFGYTPYPLAPDGFLRFLAHAPMLRNLSGVRFCVIQLRHLEALSVIAAQTAISASRWAVYMGDNANFDIQEALRSGQFGGLLAVRNVCVDCPTTSHPHYTQISTAIRVFPNMQLLSICFPTSSGFFNNARSVLNLLSGTEASIRIVIVSRIQGNSAESEQNVRQIMVFIKDVLAALEAPLLKRLCVTVIQAWQSSWKEDGTLPIKPGISVPFCRRFVSHSDWDVIDA